MRNLSNNQCVAAPLPLKGGEGHAACSLAVVDFLKWTHISVVVWLLFLQSNHNFFHGTDANGKNIGRFASFRCLFSGNYH